MNKSEILKQAWVIFRNEKLTFSNALKKSWAMYKAPKADVKPDLSFDTLYKLYYQDVLTSIKYKIKEIEIAEELANDVFMKVYEKLYTFDGSKSSIRTWILNVTKYHTIDYLRSNDKRMKKTRRLDLTCATHVKKIGSCFQDNVQKEINQTINNTIDNILNENQKRIYELRFNDGMKYEEIAELVGISLSSVKVTINRSRKILQSNPTLKNCHTALYN
jgi:RNA polymerase sigma-70 factor (ECF subfamily)